MEVLKPKIVFLCLVAMGCLPAEGYADTLQEAIDEALIVPIATLEAEANIALIAISPEFEAAVENREAALDNRESALDKYMRSPEYQAALDSGIDSEALERESDKVEAAIAKYRTAEAKERAMRDAMAEIYADTIANAKAKTRQSKHRARHCRATLKSVDDHMEIVEIVNCVQTMEAIADMCGTATEQFRVNKELLVSVTAELDALKQYATQCVTKNITGFSALMVYEVRREATDQYAGLIEKCRREETNTLGVLGYEFIWPCFKGYLDMIDEPLEPPPTEISPEPAEDSGILPKVKA